MDKLSKSQHDTGENTRNKLMGKISRYGVIIACLDVPISFMMNFVKLVDWMLGQSLSEKYTTTHTPPKDPIYHISKNRNINNIRNTSNIGKMVVQLPDTGMYQMLPPRISFSPYVDGCFYGLYRHVNEVAIPLGNGIYEARLAVYEGIHIPGATRYIREELINFAVPLRELQYTKEVCVVNEINVEYIGTTVYRFYRNKSFYDPSRLIDYHFIDVEKENE